MLLMFVGSERRFLLPRHFATKLLLITWELTCREPTMLQISCQTTREEYIDYTTGKRMAFL